MTDLLTKSLAHLVTENHQAAGVFERYHLDFCCKGKRTLQQACRDNRVNPAEVLRELEKITEKGSADPNINPARMPLRSLIDHITSTHHSYVRQELPLILGYLQKIASKHGDRHPELHRIVELFTAIKEELELHMQKEEQILFPRIAATAKLAEEGRPLQHSTGFIGGPVAVMEHEHDHAGTMLFEIRKLTNNYTPPADACTTYQLSFAALQAFELDLHQHIHLENNILFPGAMKLFPEGASVL